MCGVFPARAGMNRRQARVIAHEPCVPRPRGDEPTPTEMMQATVGCSPPARG